jgi:predicted nucleic acid-binding protein
MSGFLIDTNDDLTIITRNTRDFEGIGAAIINPWEAA